MERNIIRGFGTLCIALLIGGSAWTQTILQAHTPVGTLGFTVGPRLFSKAVIDSLAKADHHVDSLVVYPSTIRVTEGGSFELSKLYVLAIDSKGERVTKAPLELELKAFNCTLGTERIMGFRQGSAKLQIRSLLPRHDKKSKTAVEIGVVITSWPNF
jgi:hypothetical protein